MERKDELKYIALGKAFEKLTQLQRIRNLGSAKIGSHRYQHAGYEFWTSYGMTEDQEEYAPKFAKEKDKALGVLYTMLIAFDGGGQGIDEDKHESPKISTIEELIEYFNNEENQNERTN